MAVELNHYNPAVRYYIGINDGTIDRNRFPDVKTWCDYMRQQELAQDMRAKPTPKADPDALVRVIVFIVAAPIVLLYFLVKMLLDAAN